MPWSACSSLALAFTFNDNIIHRICVPDAVFDKPMTVARVVFAHGKSFHDGGWFDASAGKPQVQIKRVAGGAWETIGTLDDYPATTATDNRGLKDGQQFTLKLKEPLSIVALCVSGTPASGDGPNQAFSSCAELGAFEK